jgi:hypothetical protein
VEIRSKKHKGVSGVSTGQVGLTGRIASCPARRWWSRSGVEPSRREWRTTMDKLMEV